MLKKLPKLNLSELISFESYHANKESIFTTNETCVNNAIDSNRAVAFAYYTRKLLHNSWKAFFNYKLEKAN